ncbi:MAG TPA: hypothetical protein VFF76_03490 [Holophagaceae bacterium]|jgi:hypothetical protein|nr:hypothetical protein [Holophagaceae bacterium]
MSMNGNGSPAGSQAPMWGENLAKFWELQGRPVLEWKGVWWGQHRGASFRCLPFHRVVDLGPEEIRGFLRASSIRALSFTSDRPGLPRGLYVIRPEGYGLHAVSRKQRGHVTHGLEACAFRQLDGDELAVLGMPLNRDTLGRQSREDATFLDPLQWKRFVQAVDRCPAMAIHGAFADGKLATYVISCREGPWLHLIHKMSSTSGREHHPDHALDYSIIRNAASDPGIQFIANGATSVLPHEGLDRYKRQLGYQVEAHSLSIHFHPLLAPVLCNKATVAVAKRAQALFPRNERLAYGAKLLEGALISHIPESE